MMIITPGFDDYELIVDHFLSMVATYPTECVNLQTVKRFSGDILTEDRVVLVADDMIWTSPDRLTDPTTASWLTVQATGNYEQIINVNLADHDLESLRRLAREKSEDRAEAKAQALAQHNELLEQRRRELDQSFLARVRSVCRADPASPPAAARGTTSAALG